MSPPIASAELPGGSGWLPGLLLKHLPPKLLSQEPGHPSQAFGTYLKKNLSAPDGVLRFAGFLANFCMAVSPRVAGFSIYFFIIQCIVNRRLAEP